MLHMLSFRTWEACRDQLGIAHARVRHWQHTAKDMHVSNSTRVSALRAGHHLSLLKNLRKQRPRHLRELLRNQAPTSQHTTRTPRVNPNPTSKALETLHAFDSCHPAAACCCQGTHGGLAWTAFEGKRVFWRRLSAYKESQIESVYAVQRNGTCAHSNAAKINISLFDVWLASPKWQRCPVGCLEAQKPQNRPGNQDQPHQGSCTAATSKLYLPMSLQIPTVTGGRHAVS